jgi:hypothetical protein
LDLINKDLKINIEGVKDPVSDLAQSAPQTPGGLAIQRNSSEQVVITSKGFKADLDSLNSTARKLGSR